jgi:hypothetical protein
MPTSHEWVRRKRIRDGGVLTFLGDGVAYELSAGQAGLVEEG